MYTVDEEFSNPAAITVKCTVEFRNNANFVYPGLYAARLYTVVFILKILMGNFLKSSIYFVTLDTNFHENLHLDRVDFPKCIYCNISCIVATGEARAATGGAHVKTSDSVLKQNAALYKNCHYI